MLKIKDSKLSLRNALLLCLSVTILPLLLSASVGYFILKNTVIADFQKVSDEQRKLIDPTQRLRLSILEADVFIEEFLITNNAGLIQSYRFYLQDFESDLIVLTENLSDENLISLLEDAIEEWRAFEDTVAELITLSSDPDQPIPPALIASMENSQAFVLSRLTTIYDSLENDLSEFYTDAVIGYERVELLSLFAFILSFIFMALGLFIFSRTVLHSINALVEGAGRFASGERDHMIQVNVPVELHQVANEFNKMIKIIGQSEEKLTKLATTDGLTGLLNRRSFDEAINTCYTKFQRFGDVFGLITLDIDHFKKINDTFGHDAGDEILKVVSKRIVDSVRNIDTVFRCGGEEFSILLPRADDETCFQIAERIRKNIGEHSITLDNSSRLDVTISLGYEIIKQEHDVESLEKAADIALYKAKESGRNRTVRSSDTG